MPNERFQFPGAEGQQLAASLDLPERQPVAYALFAHCFTCGKDVLAAKRIAVALAARRLWRGRASAVLGLGAVYRTAADAIHLRYPLRHDLVALRQYVGRIGNPRSAQCVSTA